MEKVTGIGGLFFRAREPAALARWYEAHLGVTMTPTDYVAEPWRQDAGPTVFAPFPEQTEYFGDAKLLCQCRVIAPPFVIRSNKLILRDQSPRGKISDRIQ